jgi:ABC-type bacteriocin/lantibiotic exporter with double-glycine peptidase domain
MINDNLKNDKAKDLSIQKNLNQSILYISGSNFIAAFIFFVIWVINPNIWFLVLSIILAVCGIAYYFVIKKAENKFLSNKENDENQRMSIF